MKILIAPNAFKESLTAVEAGNEIAIGLSESKLDADVHVLPIADGGDGSLSILAHYLQAEILTTTVADPTGRKIQAKYGLNKKTGIAVVEMAEASGIRLLEKNELNPWVLNTKGTGELIQAAVKAGAFTVYLTLGGSATVDGGMGILKSLNVKFFSEGAQFIPTGPCDFHKMDGLDAALAMRVMKNVWFKILTDVDNPLLGEKGAVRVFGKQKGIEEDEQDLFESNMQHWANLLKNYTDKPVDTLAGGGAAGGVAAAMTAFFNAEIRSGAREILHLSGFEQQLAAADLIITTEGKIDAQTSYGKGPGWVARLANEKNKPVIALCGQIDDDYQPQDSLFDGVFPINSMLYPLKTAIARTRPNLRFTAMQLGNLLAVQRR